MRVIMSNSLYSEALRAAEEIKNAAEEKAKQQLIEAMTPQIKLMVEQNLMEETDAECGTETIGEEDTDAECGSESDEGKNSEDKDRQSNPATKDDEVKDDKKSLHGTKLEAYEMSSEASSVLSKLVNSSAKNKAVRTKLEEIAKGILVLKKATLLAENRKINTQTKKRINLLYKNLVSETKNIASYDIFKKDNELLKEFYNVIKELNNMSRRRSNQSRYLNENLEDLLEMNLFEEDGDDEESEDAFADMGGEDDSDPLADMEMESAPAEGGTVDGNTTVEELAQMAGLLDSADEAPAEEEPEEEPEEDDELPEGLFEYDEDPEEALGETDEVDVEGLSSAKHESRRRDVVLEIDENMLRKEISRMKTLREGEAKDMAGHFGGGSLEGELFVDGVELNKLHEMKIKAAKVVRMNRMLESKLSQYKKALRGMKTQLTEMNLFNAKLLYANKLMQNRDLTIKQQRNIVESLDEAKTLGEAKILFESLSKSLVRPANTRSGNLSEGAIRRPMSSSSRPVRSGQSKPINESVALDRWATLAGIRK